jgi:dTDP-4-dehydrorhamnose reductase
MKRLLVTGAGGFVAGSVIRQAAGNWKVEALSGKERPVDLPNLCWHKNDLLDPDFLERFLQEIKPDAVIHAAAVADIDFCESHKDIAEKMNAGVTVRLANLCKQTGTRMVYLSTDSVFDGERGNYSEEDRPSPVNYYAETKVRGEEAVRAMDSDWVIARLSLVVGLPTIGAGNSFLPKMLAVLESGKEVGVPGNEIRTPVDVITLGRALLELAGREETGIFHLAGNDPISRFEMAKRIAEKWGCPSSLVVRKDSDSIPGRATRPRDASLDNSKSRRLLETPMLGLDEALDLIRRESRP